LNNLDPPKADSSVWKNIHLLQLTK
jgi:hypothetical protein